MPAFIVKLPSLLLLPPILNELNVVVPEPNEIVRVLKLFDVNESVL